MPSGKGKSHEHPMGERHVIQVWGKMRTLAPHSVRRKGKVRFIEDCTEAELRHAEILEGK